MTPAHVLVLAAMACHLSGYTMPDHPPPKVHEVTRRELVDRHCGAGTPFDAPCANVAAMYTDGGDIYVDVEYTRSAASPQSEDAYVVHELVHWLQYEHQWGGYECPHAQARENEAYRIQNSYSCNEEKRCRVIEPADVCLNELRKMLGMH